MIRGHKRREFVYVATSVVIKCKVVSARCPWKFAGLLRDELSSFSEFLHMHIFAKSASKLEFVKLYKSLAVRLQHEEAGVAFLRSVFLLLLPSWQGKVNSVLLSRNRCKIERVGRILNLSKHGQGLWHWWLRNFNLNFSEVWQTIVKVLIAFFCSIAFE